MALLYQGALGKNMIKIEGEIKTSYDKNTLNKFMATKPSLHKTPEGILWTGRYTIKKLKRDRRE
jgi:cell division protein YceG involved in septum cleavage